MDISPARIWREKPFSYRLEVLECPKCKRRYVGNVEECPKCGAKLERKRLPRKGRVIAWTKVVQVPEFAEDFAPLYIGLIELEDGSRVVAKLVDVVEPSDGMEVEAVLRRVRVDGQTGLIEYALCFRPIL
ncbi:AcaC [Ignicoccus pacificus DSM 13166]|uniref:AcaC n=1 Tax=Ignicoccus pacificus DSM 13166 TaxID=940294 RepID=A0A977PJW7_9CREN|nr:AcaC [Ignicoccus pacificus DSM 13166]